MRRSRVFWMETADQWEKGIVGSGNRKSRVLGWETADQVEKGIVGSGNRKSRGLNGKTADQLEKRIVGSGWGKTAGETRAQSPKSNWSNGGGPWTPKKRRHLGKNNLLPDFLGFLQTKSFLMSVPFNKCSFLMSVPFNKCSFLISVPF